MKYLIKLIVLFAFITIFSCNKNNCSENLGFKIDKYLFDEVKSEGKTYCQLVNKSLSGNSRSIVKLSKLKVSDGGSYQHGAVLIEVIDKISEKKYLSIISSLNEKQKKSIYFSYLSAGMDYTVNEKYKEKNIEKAFPLIYKVFRSKGIIPK